MIADLDAKQQRQLAIGFLMLAVIFVLGITAGPVWYANASRQAALDQAHERLQRCSARAVLLARVGRRVLMLSSWAALACVLTRVRACAVRDARAKLCAHENRLGSLGLAARKCSSCCSSFSCRRVVSQKCPVVSRVISL